MNPNPAIENYLKTIYSYTEWQSDPITPSVLAAQLGIAPPSVTEMVKKLAANGLINHVPYGPLTLTKAGRTLALGVLRRHRLIETWLVREMDYSWDEVHDEAEILEHSISERLLTAIEARLGFPETDPHGDPIPSRNGVVKKYSAIQLCEARPGDSGILLRISDRDPALLRSCAESGVSPGVRITIVSVKGTTVQIRTSDADGVRTEANHGRGGRSFTVTNGTAIWVAPIEKQGKNAEAHHHKEARV